MVLSSSERDDLVGRVEQKLGRGAVRRDVIRDVVDRTLGALPDATPASIAALEDAREGARDLAREDRDEAARGTAIVAAASTPDLASRLRRQLEGSGVTIHHMAVATEGRFTVATLAVSEASQAAVRSAAETLGARISWRGAGR